MNAKDYLERGKLLSAEINALSQALANVRSEVNKTAEIAGIKQRDSVKARHENALMYFNELKANINSRIIYLLETKKDILNFVESMEDPRYRCVLMHRYVNNYTFEKISQIMYINERWVYRIHKKALEEADKMLLKS